MKTAFSYMIILLISCSSLHALGQSKENSFDLTIQVNDEQTKKPLEYAIVYLSKDQISKEGLSNKEGILTINNVEAGVYKITVSLLGYKRWSNEVDIRSEQLLHVPLLHNTTPLNEVVVTASESRGITSSSIIDQKAMQHLQPSSFSDLLELLPGGKSQDPYFSGINTIRIRETGMLDTSTKYNISSLGVSFVMDGTPISTDANLQALSSTDNNDRYRSSVNKGVDMRTISTDQIERVEIVRGIPSVEYGDLTSGLVKIERKKGATPWHARLKVDGYVKLFALDKGFYFKKQDLSLNFGGDFLDSNSNPTNSYAGYQRLTYSIRLNKKWRKEAYELKWNAFFDHSHTFDDIKTDPNIFDNVEESADLESLKKEKYNSKYDRFSFSNSLSFIPKRRTALKEINLTAAVSHELAKIEKTVFVQRSSMAQTVPLSDEEGTADGLFLPSKYVTYNNREGKPLNIFLKGKAKLAFTTANINHNIKGGIEYTFDKNYGKGNIIDRLRPIGENIQRDRKFSDIPAKQMLNFYLEDEASMPFRNNLLKVSIGLRGMTMIGMDNSYKMQGKVYLDPRLNASWSFPSITINNKDFNISLAGGIGWHSKFPTLDQIYPDYSYIDIVRLNYYNVEDPEKSRVNYQTFKYKTINYNLEPARNQKWEVRLNLEYDNNQLTITYFKERMNNGFRPQYMEHIPYSYKKFYNDKDSIVINPTTNRPDLEESKYYELQGLLNKSAYGNGTRIDKEGIEFTLSTKRFEALKTRLTISGAWFKSKYLNSVDTYEGTSKLINGQPIVEIGIFDSSGGDHREELNTNFMLDTYIPSLGFEFSTSFQCQWYSLSQRVPVTRYPFAYIDGEGKKHPFTEVERQDVRLQNLVRESNPSLYEKNKIPFGMNVNFKASKRIKDIARISLFVNKLLDYYPDYKVNKAVIKRNVTPYFGMEVNITL